MIQTKTAQPVSHILWGDLTTNRVDVIINGTVNKLRLDELQSSMGKSYVENCVSNVNALRRTMLESLDTITDKVNSDDHKKILGRFKTAIENCNYEFITNAKTVKEELSPLWVHIKSEDTQLRIEFTLMVDLFIKYCVN